MNTDIMRKFVEVLRSDKYEFCTGSLVSVDGTRFCSLGVFVKEFMPEYELSQIEMTLIVGDTIKIVKFVRADGDTLDDYDPIYEKMGVNRYTCDMIFEINDDSSKYDPVIDYLEKLLEKENEDHE